MSNFDIRLIAVLPTEWRVTTKTFEHDSPKTPPITFFTIPFPRKNLWCDIVRCAHSRIRHQSSVVSSHSEDSLSILGSHCEVDGIDGDGFATRWGVRLIVE